MVKCPTWQHSIFVVVLLLIAALLFRDTSSLVSHLLFLKDIPLVSLSISSYLQAVYNPISYLFLFVYFIGLASGLERV
jgi:hypothetical protein